MNNLKVQGISTASGGKYGEVCVEGIGTITSDVECDSMKVSGIVKVNGSIEAKDLLVEGKCNMRGNVKALTCRLEGMLSVGSVSAEDFFVNGAFQADGDLNAEKINIKFDYYASAQEIYGGEIKIRKHKHDTLEFVMDLIPWKHKGKDFQCKVIEGDIIDIEHVKSEVVRGRRVTIGPNCVIKEAEYHEEIYIDPSAKVEQITQIAENNGVIQ